MCTCNTNLNHTSNIWHTIESCEFVQHKFPEPV
uniref:Uncharacterized protein n=1 Tax=Arundo donax TaxID=35708 RepID=A0A0A9BYY9_ARUDO